MTRICSSDGNWLAPDFTQCVVREGVGPFALVWMTFSTSSGSYFVSQLDRIRHDVSSLTYQSKKLTATTGMSKKDLVNSSLWRAFKYVLDTICMISQYELVLQLHNVD